MRRGWGAPLAAALLLGGAALMLYGVWIPAKAALAQQLIDRAWQETRRTGEPSPPWPWADTVPIARLRAPRLQISTLVLSGATGASLAFGPGHLSGTPAPGAAGNSAIAGHRDTHFRFLAELKPGDTLELETADRGFHRYEVYRLEVVHERETRVLTDAGLRELTLLTCYPFHALRSGGPLRYVVRALARDEPDPTPPLIAHLQNGFH